MPTSLPIFDDELETYFSYVQPKSVLDIGAGDGKYGKMLKRLQPTANCVGVECEQSYIEQFGLCDIYDEVLLMDASRLMDDVRLHFDAVIVGDVIEHMRKSAGMDLLNFFVYRSSVIFVKFPVQMPQDDWEGHVSEAHVSVWSQRDFAGFDHVFLERELMQMAVIRGYRNQAIEWLPLKFIQQLGWENCTAFYNERPQRWELADRETRWQKRCESDLNALLGRDDRVIIVDEEQTKLMSREGSRRIPFLERNGQYFGMPADDDDALAELRRQVDAGVRWLVVTPNSFWLLKYYGRFVEELRTKHICALEADRLVVFKLCGR